MDVPYSAALAGASFERLNAALGQDSAGHWELCLGALCLRSAFQPVYSLAHGRAVGHEALLRARDGRGRPVAAPQALHRGGSFAEMLTADRAARLVHALNFARQSPLVRDIKNRKDPAAHARVLTDPVRVGVGGG